jgi:hypothetical protein
MANNGSVAVSEKMVVLDVEAFKASFASLSTKQKSLVIYWLLRDLLGAQPTQETGVFDPDDFLYLWLVPAGNREALRYLEHPELREHLEQARTERGVPIEEAREQILKEIGVSREELGLPK